MPVVPHRGTTPKTGFVRESETPRPPLHHGGVTSDLTGPLLHPRISSVTAFGVRRPRPDSDTQIPYLTSLVIDGYNRPVPWWWSVTFVLYYLYDKYLRKDHGETGSFPFALSCTCATMRGRPGIIKPPAPTIRVWRAPFLVSHISYKRSSPVFPFYINNQPKWANQRNKNQTPPSPNSTSSPSQQTPSPCRRHHQSP